MDWAALAEGRYVDAVNNVPKAAADLVRFIKLLKYTDADGLGPNDDVHLIGFGIGAHLAGNVGYEFRNFAPIGTITGNYYCVSF